VLATPLSSTPGSRQIYSDVGADVLGFVVEAIAHEPLDAFVRRNVFAPLGMRSTLFRPGASLRTRIAPTERLSSRGHPLRGEVHDPAAYAMGGVAGHAGLFGTAGDLAIFARMMLGGGSYDGVRIFSDSTVALFTRRSAGTRALGWETCAGGASCGQHMGERAFGHTGFTGTSIWIDPERDLFVIVLSNRIHELPGGRVPPGAVLADVRADVADIAELSLPLAGVLPAMPARLRADRGIGWPARSTVSAFSSEGERTAREPF
jgi:CubicO group peptidase (beta-lactamase class C family)